MLKSYFKIRDDLCIVGNAQHAWSNHEDNKVRLCLKCFQPMLVVR